MGYTFHSVQDEFFQSIEKFCEGVIQHSGTSKLDIYLTGASYGTGNVLDRKFVRGERQNAELLIRKWFPNCKPVIRWGEPDEVTALILETLHGNFIIDIMDHAASIEKDIDTHRTMHGRK